jgi:GTP-binding protein EngB required for normal cell division
MSGPFDLQPVLALANRLAERAGQFPAFEPAARLALRLQKASAIAAGTAFARPVVAALVGGTGTGKSSLFNALVGQPDASPVSHTRPATLQPFLAALPGDVPLLRELVELGCRHVQAGHPGLALVDTPDLDSIEAGNRQWTRRVLETVDVVIYVASPDKVSNFEINREIREWTRQKRWFFVLNKIDTLSREDQQTLRQHFDLRLRKLGFEVDDRTRFLVSAKQPREFEFEALRRAVFSSRAAENVRVLRTDAVLAMVEHAAATDVMQPLGEGAEAVRQVETSLNARVKEAYRTALASPAATEAVQILLRNQTWQDLAARTGWIMGMIVWLRVRLTLVSSAWQLGRMLTRGPSLFGMAWLAVASVAGAMRGVLPFRKLSAALGDQCRRALEEITLEARQKLEDLGFLALQSSVLATEHGAPSPGDRAGEQVADAWLQTVQAVPWVGKEAARAMALTLGSRTAGEELLAPVQAAIESAAATAARKAMGWFTAFMSNLLPTVMLGHVAWRVGHAWYDGIWLPWTFYGMAITVFLLSLLPGWLLIVAAVKSRARLPDAARIADSTTDPAATAVLRDARLGLEQIQREARQLVTACNAIRRTLASELPAEHFGLTPTAEVQTTVIEG